jgi:hypothetical protein
MIQDHPSHIEFKISREKINTRQLKRKNKENMLVLDLVRRYICEERNL